MFCCEFASLLDCNSSKQCSAVAKPSAMLAWDSPLPPTSLLITLVSMKTVQFTVIYSNLSIAEYTFAALVNGPKVSVLGCGKQSAAWYTTIP